MANLSFDAWVSDLEAVVEAHHIESFVLLGISQGGPVAIEYTARHPEKVEKLLLYGAYTRGFLKRGGSLEEHNARTTLTRQGWGRDDPTYRQLFTSGCMPDATIEQANWFNELQVSTSPENAAEVQEVMGGIDVLHRVTEIEAPTLVLHAVGDLRVPFEQISFNTVTNHVKNILGKTGCANRTEAAAYAIPRGLS